MSFWSRIANVLRGDRLSRDIDHELQSHIEEAIEQGRDPAEARREFGSPLRMREQARDVRIFGWLDSLRADAVFGWRQLVKRKITSSAAILSLALAIGSCTAAFRLIDALLLRPLPVANPERLYALTLSGPGVDSYFAYPVFRQMRSAVKDQAELIALSIANPTELTHGSYQETEEPFVQYVSGRMFPALGLQPARGRLLTENDDRKDAQPCAVLSYNYWTRRFGQDPKVIGRTFRMENKLYEIVGVGPDSFTGTEPGTVTDIFLPTCLYSYEIDQANLVWLQIWAQLKPGVPLQPVRDRLRAAFQSIDQPSHGATLSLETAAAGVSWTQNYYRLPLTALSVLVGLVLLIACANVANLMMAQAAAREHELALRVSIGAGRGRLVQLVLVESALLAGLAGAAGGFFAWRSMPLIVDLIQPARLFLPLDWRVMGFGAALTLGVTLLFGLAPALRASAVKPAGALKGGERPRSQRRGMNALVALQAAFCCLVLFLAGLFVATFDRLTHQPNGFSSERLLILDTVAEHPQPAVLWERVAQHLRYAPGVESVGLASRPLLQGSSWVAGISINGGPPSNQVAFRLPVSPGWLDTMRIPILDGRDFLPSDSYPGVGIVSHAFAQRHFGGENPIGKVFETVEGDNSRNRFRIVGVVGDTRYRSIREPLTATIFVPFQLTDAKGAARLRSRAAILVRTASRDPLAQASLLSDEIRRMSPEFRINYVSTQQEMIDKQTVRERLLALLARFFALVALLLAGIGLYGVLDYTVLQRRREIGIRMALGARTVHVARGVTVEVFVMVLIGAAAGLALGMVCGRYVASLLYQVKATDIGMLALPSVTLLAAALLAALPAVIRAVRIDPAAMLRMD